MKAREGVLGQPERFGMWMVGIGQDGVRLTRYVKGEVGKLFARISKVGLGVSSDFLDKFFYLYSCCYFPRRDLLGSVDDFSGLFFKIMYGIDGFFL